MRSIATRGLTRHRGASDRLMALERWERSLTPNEAYQCKTSVPNPHSARTPNVPLPKISLDMERYTSHPPAHRIGDVVAEYGGG